ncbi:GDSL-type esterase/lipase family protein [Guptibacillus algicola]|uniref:GDSL-type esterase/lipase family protein n=1 Tax=Guptibacillus algicola TaxID=225844 RepID=UPI001CD2ED91|nr:GDSL-type esterase/lipase family protein [Alkalihalobacillus algicola]MCA0987780.1 GDSL-type esterase/lipase family protein [Alkalihalobacillus algicola]
MPVLVCFGDCLTAKEVDEKGNERLTSLIRNQLEEWIVINAGSSPTTREGVSRFQTDVLSYQPDFVTILFGTQEACLNHENNLSEFEKNIGYMLNNLPQERVILISPSPIRDEENTSFTNHKIEGYADRVKHLSKKFDTKHIDLWSIIKHHKSQESLYENDGVQLNRKGYKLITKELFKALGVKSSFRRALKLF